MLSVVSLGWQIVSWRRSGPRIKVERIQGRGVGHLDPTWFIGVKADNSGRLQTQVQQFGFQLLDGESISPTGNYHGNPIRVMDLPPGGTASLEYDAQEIRDALAGRRLRKWPHIFARKNVRPFVVTRFATGLCCQSKGWEVWRAQKLAAAGW